MAGLSDDEAEALLVKEIETGLTRRTHAGATIEGAVAFAGKARAPGDPRAQGRARAERKAALREPIAIVGMGMRFPGGVNDAEAFAKLLWSGTDAITEIPADRWSLEDFYADDPDAFGKMTTRYGAFIEQWTIRCRVLRHLTARGGEYGSAAASAAGGRLAGAGGRGPCAHGAGW